MKLTGGSDRPNRLTWELQSGARVALEEHEDGTLTIRETTHRLLAVVPHSRNMIEVQFQQPLGFDAPARRG